MLNYLGSLFLNLTLWQCYIYFYKIRLIKIVKKNLEKQTWTLKQPQAFLYFGDFFLRKISSYPFGNLYISRSMVRNLSVEANKRNLYVFKDSMWEFMCQYLEWSRRKSCNIGEASSHRDCRPCQCSWGQWKINRIITGDQGKCEPWVEALYFLSGKKYDTS